MTRNESTLTTTLTIDGVEVAEGSAEVVAAYKDLVREAAHLLNEASALLGSCPDVVEQTWRKSLHRATRPVEKHADIVSRFSNDYQGHDLPFAVAEASFRGELGEK